MLFQSRSITFDWICLMLFEFLTKPDVSPSSTPGHAAFMRQMHDRSLAAIDDLAYMYRHFRATYGLSRVSLFMVQGATLGCFTAITSLDGAGTRASFAELCTVVLAASQRFRFARAIVRMLRPTAQQRGVALPADVLHMLRDFDENLWRPGDHRGFCSTYPNYTLARDIPDDEHYCIGDLLAKWEALHLPLTPEATSDDDGRGGAEGAPN